VLGEGEEAVVLANQVDRKQLILVGAVLLGRPQLGLRVAGVAVEVRVRRAPR
jgi:hypothetical protein